jgi:uncharacterized membrane protein YeaQ/YmgE (transglycosylase-associated protein family)
MINFILWLIVGGLAGWIASKIMGTDAQQGILLNIIVGIIGAFIGGFIAGLFGIQTTTFSILGFIIAIIGACILLFLVGLVTGNRRRI